MPLFGKNLTDPFGVNERRDRAHEEEMRQMEADAAQDRIGLTEAIGLAVTESLGTVIGELRADLAAAKDLSRNQAFEMVSDGAYRDGLLHLLKTISAEIDRIYSQSGNLYGNEMLLVTRDRKGVTVGSNKERRRIFVDGYRAYYKDLREFFKTNNTWTKLLTIDEAIAYAEKELVELKMIAEPHGPSI